MCTDRRPLMDASGADRDALFALAEQVSGQLNDLGGSLRGLIKDVNASQGAAATEASAETDPLGTAIKVLNNQLATLQWVDAQTADVARRLDALES